MNIETRKDDTGTIVSYIVPADRFEDMQDRLDAAEASLRVREDGGIPLAVVKLELEGNTPLAAWRKYRGLTQAGLAEKAAVRQPYISAIESGKQPGTVDTLKALADALDTIVDNLID
ncbi:helix-turn-helix domain-containing protein [Eilatimonas milleporae]|uniref:Helix-turn-helix protein n=1 Tax=Eilatimonas milleporae TaxID=911205 RepID=A0A3M0D038_9PROT|nr:helix-turn-helix transcriptional regulator [Eilatimonas milleporae]RMB13026.1 helix-turn-helix protein [Eilatimonas milleporae]